MIQHDEQKTDEFPALSPYDRPSLYNGTIDTFPAVPSTPPLTYDRPEKSDTKRPRQRNRLVIPFLSLVFLISIVSIGLFTGWEYSKTTSKSITTTVVTPTSTIEAQQEAAIAKVESGVVELKVPTAQGQQLGSGVIIDSQGDIVTNNHVVSGGQSVTAVLSNGKTEQAQIIGTDASNDLAVVRIQPFTDMTVIEIGDSSKLKVGQEVLAIGNPLGITETATKGIVSALNRSVTESNSVTLAHAIQTDAAINPGNSGGALINLQGQLTGIPTLTAVNTESNTAANGLSFAIPSSTIQTTIQHILQQNR